MPRRTRAAIDAAEIAASEAEMAEALGGVPVPEDPEISMGDAERAIEEMLLSVEETVDRAEKLVETPDAITMITNSRNLVEKKIELERRKLRNEQADLKRQRDEEYRLAIKEKRKPRPWAASPLIAQRDPSIIVDEDGRPAGDPEKSQRWVRVYNENGKLDNSRILRRMAEGATVVRSRVTNKPIKSQFGVLMEETPDITARRRAAAEVAAVPMDEKPRLGSHMQEEREVSTRHMTDKEARAEP